MIISAEEWKSLQETPFWMSHNARDDVAAGLVEYEAGETRSEARVRRVDYALTVGAYRVEVTSSATRDMNRIPPRYLTATVHFLYGPLAENPHRLGGPLGNELEGSRSARRGAYRILYTVIDDDHVVVVHRIDHRATAYKPR